MKDATRLQSSYYIIIIELCAVGNSYTDKHIDRM